MNPIFDPSTTPRPTLQGDPHMTSFRGQKFDFVGNDNGWYAAVSDLPYMPINMRVTSPVPTVPEITYKLHFPSSLGTPTAWTTPLSSLSSTHTAWTAPPPLVRPRASPMAL